jgi:hypothetical protein
MEMGGPLLVYYLWFCVYVVAVYILEIHQFSFPFGVKPE